MSYNILEKVSDINGFISQLKDRRDTLYEYVSQVDSEICDIQHAAEFFNLSASQGYKLYRMLHDATVRRRVYKDEIQQIDIVLGNIDSDAIKGIEKKLKRTERKTYTPRVLKELFES